MPKAWSKKDERQYEHVKESEAKEGRSAKVAKRIAAATVNKQRSSEGRTEEQRSGRKKSKKKSSKKKTGKKTSKKAARSSSKKTGRKKTSTRSKKAGSSRGSSRGGGVTNEILTSEEGLEAWPMIQTGHALARQLHSRCEPTAN